MVTSSRVAAALLASLAVIALSAGGAYTQGEVVDPAKNNLPNPTAMVVKDWGKLPAGRMWDEPNDVITAPNGDIFVADGHSGQNPNPPPGSTGRIIKFTRDGKFIKEWGRIGTGPGEFRTPHALAFDSRGRLFVADRGNHRIQIFDQEGKLLDTWHQFRFLRTVVGSRMRLAGFPALSGRLAVLASLRIPTGSIPWRT